MNERQVSVSGMERVNGRYWVQTVGGRQSEIFRLEECCDRSDKGTTVISEHFSPDAYGLLILAPEIALGSGWLGGDKVVGRAAIRDLLIKAARFNENERQRLTIHLPSRAITLRLDEIEWHCGA